MRVLVPATAGGIADTISRFLADVLRQEFGQPVVAENRPGANGILCSETLARSNPDGHTIGYMLYGAMILNPLLINNLSYKISDFKPLTTSIRAQLVLAVGPHVPVNNVREFVDYAKNQGILSYGTLGPASVGQIVMEMLRGVSGINLENVGYRGENLAVTDMIAGNIPAVCIGTMSVFEQHRAGRAKIIAITSQERLAAMPDLPTFIEQGFPVDFNYFHGVMLPAATPDAIAERLHTCISAALRSPELRSRLTPEMQSYPLSRADFSDLLQQETSKLARLIQDRGIRIQ
jgi:tripartite-type tricarboxylate transporter receptor subunit TctC